MSTGTAGFPATPKAPGNGPQPTAGIAHGLTAVLPGYHRVQVRTLDDDDAETIASMLRRAGCETFPLFDIPSTEGTYTR